MKFLNNPKESGLRMVFKKDGNGYTYIRSYDISKEIEEADDLICIYVEDYDKALDVLLQMFHYKTTYKDDKYSAIIPECVNLTSSMICSNLIRRIYYISSIELFYLAASVAIKDELLPEYEDAIKEVLFKKLPPYVKYIKPYLLATYNLLEFDSKKNLTDVKPLVSCAALFNNGPYRGDGELDILAFLFEAPCNLQVYYRYEENKDLDLNLPANGLCLVLPHNQEYTFALAKEVTGKDLVKSDDSNVILEYMQLPEDITLEEYQCRILKCVEKVYSEYESTSAGIEAASWGEEPSTFKGLYRSGCVELIEAFKEYVLSKTKNKDYCLGL